MRFGVRQVGPKSTPATAGGRVFTFGIGGEAATGRTLWNTQGREGEHASMLGDRSWLLATTTEGVLVVARTNPRKYEEVRRYEVAQSALWAHPAITGHSIVVKDTDKVICWGSEPSVNRGASGLV